MSITVKCFDDRKAKAELKKCPKIVRDYVKLLEENMKRWQDLTALAVSKLKSEARQPVNLTKGYRADNDLTPED